MSKIICIAQGKGGSGKTTTCVSLAAMLTEIGRKAIVADMDKNKPDAVHWSGISENGPISSIVKPLFDDNPVPELKELKSNYDFILLDTPPNLESAALKAVMVADIVLTPCSPSEFDMNQLSQVGAIAEMAKTPYYVFANKIKRNTLSSKNLIKQLCDLPQRLDSYITESVHVSDAVGYGEWIGTYKPDSDQHRQYKKLANELINILEYKS